MPQDQTIFEADKVYVFRRIATAPGQG